MKKFLVIMLLFVYGFSASGMAINLHYCCGKLKSIDLSAAVDKGCGKEHKMGAKRCCENKQISSKQKSDQEQTLFALKQLKASSALIPVSSQNGVDKPLQRPLSPVAFAPPPLYSPPLFILHCVYRL